jgi:hypothetical protein
MKTRRLPRDRTCTICERPLKAGDATRRVILVEADQRPYAVHDQCFVED